MMTDATHQIAERAAREATLTTHTAAIIGADCPTLFDHERARGRLMSLLSHGNWKIMVRDTYGIEQAIMRMCLEMERGLRVVGTTVRPSSAVPRKHYERVLSGFSTDSRWAAYAYIIAEADLVICIGTTGIEKAVPKHKLLLSGGSLHNMTEQAIFRPRSLHTQVIENAIGIFPRVQQQGMQQSLRV